jgi:DNA-binding transcriptional LysR family regulator
MELQQLKALTMVAEAGSVTEAARRLLLTQPAVTRQIRALEEELGGALFDRTTKPITPTPLGRSALDHARRILLMAEELRTTVSSDAGTLRGELRLGVAALWMRQMIPPIALELRRRYPGVQLQLTSGWSGSLTRRVAEGRIDIAVVLAPPQEQVPAGLAATRFGTEPVALISSVETALKGTVSPEALRGTGWVLNSEGCGYRAALKRTLEEAGIPFTVVAEVNDLDLQMQLVREGVGEGLIPLRALPRRLSATGLQTFSIAGVTFSLETRLLYRRTGPIIPMAVPLIERTVSRLLTSSRTGRIAQQATGPGRQGTPPPARAAIGAARRLTR